MSIEKEKIEQKWQHFFEHSLEMVLFFDEKGTIVEGNNTAKAELGYGDDLEGRSICCIFPRVLQYEKDKLEVFDDDARQRMKEEKSFETVAYRKNQTCFAVDLKIVIEEKENRFLGTCLALNTAVKVGAIKDMVKAKEKVEDATKVRNEFVSNVTHELRTPVNGILGISRNLMETELDEQQKESVNIIHMCCKNMIAIINNLLDFSKLEAGKFMIEEREFSFREAIDKIIAMNINQVNEKGLKLLLNISPEIPDQIIGDELLISQILTNLINNLSYRSKLYSIVD